MDEYLEQTAIANPQVTIHYVDPDGGKTTYSRSTTQLPPEPVEIKPHAYGIELGQLVTMLKDTSASSMAQFLTDLVFPCQFRSRTENLRNCKDRHSRQSQEDWTPGSRLTLQSNSRNENQRSRDRLHFTDR